MKAFKNNQRVRVLRAENGAEVNAPGTVVRMRRADDGAWIALDARVEGGVCPFPPDDHRGTHTMAYPEDCEAL